MLELIFKCMFLMYTMVSFNSILFGSRMISFILWPTLFLGAGLILWRLIKYKNYYRAPALPAMFLFLASFAASMLLHLQYEFKNNFINLIFLAFYFLLFYLNDENRDLQQIKKEIRFIAWIFIAFMTISVAISLVQMFTGYSHMSIVNDDNYEVITGFRWGRLWGVFLEPNVAAVMAVIACFFSVYFFVHYKNIILKVILAINVVLQMLYIAFSDSRTAIVSIFGSIFLGVFAFLWYNHKAGVLNFVKATAIALIVALVAAAMPHSTVLAYNAVVNDIEANNNTDIVEQNPEMPTVDRTYDLDEDISNRRFEIWKSAVGIFKKTPVFGTSFCGIRPFARENLPDTYIINNDQTDFRGMHNEVLNVAVSQGIVGLTALLWMCVAILIFLLKRFRKVQKQNINMACLLLACVFCFVCSIMFTSAGVFYYSAPGIPLFWMLLGYLVFIVKKSSAELKIGDN